MTIRLVSDEKIAETSSKGNQEKWFDKDMNRWYKLDQFGYEALSEAAVSAMLEKSNIEVETPFAFVRYEMEKFRVHGRERTGCSSENFLQKGQSIITISHLLSRHLGMPLKDKLASLSSDKKRIQYLVETTSEFTGLDDFPKYLTMLFEIDALFLNDDRHLNNIAVIEEDGEYKYCPIFDNGAALLSNVMYSPMDIAPSGLIKEVVARPFNTSFGRQMNAARALYGKVLDIPKLTRREIQDVIEPFLEYYAKRDRDLIADRVIECILNRQRFV